MAEETTTPAPVETPKEEQPLAEDPAKEETKEVKPEETAEKKSMFASLCGCMGGKSPPADTDAKDAPAKNEEDAEKEEVEEKPEDKPSEETPALATQEA